MIRLVREMLTFMLVINNYSNIFFLSWKVLKDIHFLQLNPGIGQRNEKIDWHDYAQIQLDANRTGV